MEHLLPLTYYELKAVATIVGTQEDTIKGIPIYPELESLQNKVKQCLSFTKTQDLPLDSTERLLSLEIKDIEALASVIHEVLFLNHFPNAIVRLPKKIKYALNFARYQEKKNSPYVFKGVDPDIKQCLSFTENCTKNNSVWAKGWRLS